MHITLISNLLNKLTFVSEAWYGIKWSEDVIHSVGMWCANCRASKNLVNDWAQVILLINCDLRSVELLYYLIMVSSFIIDACSSVSKRIRMYVSRYSHGEGGAGEQGLGHYLSMPLVWSASLLVEYHVLSRYEIIDTANFQLRKRFKIC